MAKCSSQESLCVLCDKMMEKRQTLATNLRQTPLPKGLLDALDARFSHRGLLCCEHCSPSLQALLNMLEQDESQWPAPLWSWLHVLEAFFDRDLGTGQAIAAGHVYPTIFCRRGCKIHFELDRTSLDIRKIAAGLQDDVEIAKAIAAKLGSKSFTARSTTAGEIAPGNVDVDSDGHFTPDDIGNYFLAQTNIGPFKAQFCLHFASQLCIAKHNRMAAARKLEQSLYARSGALAKPFGS
ncbi:unnamed protein product [Effrenium voratum]|uniref:Uncharacterized protein n=1 Tax=Effrenium voratum TaxID=2562239 RepID=A0AA36HVE3_9DINO|nr:unnamed protein product [Effrenium voratum]